MDMQKTYKKLQKRYVYSRDIESILQTIPRSFKQLDDLNMYNLNEEKANQVLLSNEGTEDKRTHQATSCD